MIGDILVREDGADIICLSEIADFILANYYKAGRTNLSLTRHPIEELIVPEAKRTRITDTVASLDVYKRQELYDWYQGAVDPGRRG